MSVATRQSMTIARSIGQAQNTDATAITSPTPNIVGCKKLSSSIIASCTAIQIICAQPTTKAKNGAIRSLIMLDAGPPAIVDELDAGVEAIELNTAVRAGVAD